MCDKREFWTWEKHEEMDWVLCFFEFVFIVDVHICCTWKWHWTSHRVWMIAQQERIGKWKRLEKRKKRKEGEKWFEGKERLFVFVWPCFSLLSFLPLSIHHATTLLLTLSLTTPHHTITHTWHATQACLRTVLSLCVTVIPLNPHSIKQHNTMKPWDGCSATTSSPKPFHFLNASHSAHIWQNMPTPSNWSSSQEYTGCDTHVTVPQERGTGAWADIDNCWWNTPWHSLPHHPPIKTHPLSLSFHPHSTRPGLRP